MGLALDRNRGFTPKFGEGKDGPSILRRMVHFGENERISKLYLSYPPQPALKVVP
jgi:hypothetical protein